MSMLYKNFTLLHVKLYCLFWFCSCLYKLLLNLIGLQHRQCSNPMLKPQVDCKIKLSEISWFARVFWLVLVGFVLCCFKEGVIKDLLLLLSCLRASPHLKNASTMFGLEKIGQHFPFNLITCQYWSLFTHIKHSRPWTTGGWVGVRKE